MPTLQWGQYLPIARGTPVFHFETQELNLAEDSTDATLTGTTYGGQPIQSMDTVNIVS